MPVAYLNNASTQDNYVDALTVQFAYARPAFTVQLYNAAIFYKVGVIGPANRSIVWEGIEHYSAPAMLTFEDPVTEGFPPGSRFYGMQVRSAVAGVPGLVTVS